MADANDLATGKAADAAQQPGEAGRPKFTCSGCNASFPSPQGLGAHKRYATCDVCKEAVALAPTPATKRKLKALSASTRPAAPRSTKGPRRGKAARCPHCPRTFSSGGFLVRHVAKAHAPAKPELIPGKIRQISPIRPMSPVPVVTDADLATAAKAFLDVRLDGHTPEVRRIVRQHLVRTALSANLNGIEERETT